MDNKDFKYVLLVLFLMVLFGAAIAYLHFKQVLDARQNDIDAAKKQLSALNEEYTASLEANKQALKAVQTQIDIVQSQLSEMGMHFLESQKENQDLRAHLMEFMPVGITVRHGPYLPVNRCSNIAVSNSPIAWWKLDEGSGTTAMDSSGRNNNGTLVNGSRWVKDGPGWDLSFNGASSFVSIPHDSYDNLCEGTVSAWIYLNTNEDGVIISKQHDGFNSYGIFSIGFTADTGGQLVNGVPGKLYWHAQNPAHYVGSSSTVSTGAWHLVTVVFDMAHLSFYIDGQLDSTRSGNYYLPSDVSATLTSIGYWSGGGGAGHFLDGKIKDLRIYNRTLSSQEISNLYNKAS